MANIVLISYHDCARSGQRYCKAVESCTPHRIHYSRFGRPDKRLPEIIYNADVLWFKGDNLPVLKNGKIYLYDFKGETYLSNYGGWKYNPRSKVLITVSGSFFRRGLKEDKHMSFGVIPLERYMEVADYMTALTPDLNYPELKGEYLPHAFNTQKYRNLWINSRILKISYYVAQADKKNANKYLVPAVNELLKQGYKIELVPIHGVTQEESIRLKSTASLCYEQITEIGVYGNAGVEAMMQGIPIICNISETAIKQANPYSDIYGAPCLKASDIDSLMKLLESIIHDEVDLEKVSEETKEYAYKLHDYNNVGRQVDKIIRNMYKI